jgi:Zn finger protein HypA/HybF involved in hydrogenase expression
MHEMSICEGILQVMEEQARVQNFTRVKGRCDSASTW